MLGSSKPLHFRGKGRPVCQRVYPVCLFQWLFSEDFYVQRYGRPTGPASPAPDSGGPAVKPSSSVVDEARGLERPNE